MVLNKQDFYRFADFELYPSKRALLRGDQKVILSPKSFEVLTCLVENAGRVVLKEELLQAVWPESFVEESNLTQHIFWLRKALGDRATYIVTIPGRGYQFTPKVQILNESDLSQTIPAPAIPGPALPPPLPIEVFEETTTARGPLTRKRRFIQSPWLPRLAAAALVLLAAFTGFRLWRSRHAVIRGDHHEIVLAAFENSTGDAAFDRPLNTVLAIDLNQSPYLVVTGENDTRKVLGLMSRNPDQPLTTPLAIEVCQRLNDQAVLSGAIASFGRKYLITLSAADCQTGKPLARAKATANTREDVLKAVDSVATEMRRSLGESLKSSAHPAVPLQLAHTSSLEALTAYSQGLDLFSSGKTQESIPLFQRAVALDPRFAAAYLALSNSYGRVGEYKLQRAAIVKAYDLRDQGDEFLQLSIIARYNSVVTGDLHASLQNLLSWTASYPNQPQPWIDLADVESDLGHKELGLPAAQRAVALAPNSGPAYSTLASTQLGLGDLEAAKATCNEAIRRGIDGRALHNTLLGIAFLQHDTATMNREALRARGTDQEGATLIGPLLTEGKAHAAVAIWRKDVERARKDGLTEHADRSARILLRREADYNMHAELSAQLAAMDPTRYPLNIVFANAELGRIPQAEAALKLVAASVGTDTDVRYSLYPQAQAAVALARHKPQEAIAAMEVARPYDYTSLEPMLMRARAYLAAHQPALAEAEFRRVIDHHYLSPLAPFAVLAQLGLAESLEMQGNHAAARQEYQTLFTLWKDADPDLPPLVRARAEYAAIP